MTLCWHKCQFLNGGTPVLYPHLYSTPLPTLHTHHPDRTLVPPTPWTGQRVTPEQDRGYPHFSCPQTGQGYSQPFPQTGWGIPTLHSGLGSTLFLDRTGVHPGQAMPWAVCFLRSRRKTF